MIIFHWEPPVAFTNFEIKKFFTQYSHTAKAYGQTRLLFVETSPMPDFSDQELNLTKHASLADAIAASTGTPVYVEQGGTSIWNYTFPDDPVFIFGSDYSGLPSSDLEIPGGAIHAHVAAGVVLAWHSHIQI